MHNRNIQEHCFLLKRNLVGIILTAVLISVSLSVFSQLNMPESIVYDTLFNRYLVSNYASGSIIQIDLQGNQSVFVNHMNATQGLQIVDSVVYVGCDSTVRGFYLATGIQVMNLRVDNVNNLNDVTSDNNGHLFVTDVFGNKIIKVYLESQSYSVFVEGNGIANPNGIVFDSEYNRLLVCSYRPNFPIQAVDLSDSTVSTIIETDLSYSDGIIIDTEANIYFTSWGTESIYKLDNVITNSYVEIYHNEGGPADIFFDKKHNQIAIPLQQSNEIDFFPLEPISIKEEEPFSKIDFEIKIFPLPSNTNIFIEYSLKRESILNISIADFHGNLVKTLFSGSEVQGTQTFIWDGTNISGQFVSGGVYYCKILINNKIVTKKILLIR